MIKREFVIIKNLTPRKMFKPSHEPKIERMIKSCIDMPDSNQFMQWAAVVPSSNHLVVHALSVLNRIRKYLSPNIQRQIARTILEADSRLGPEFQRQIMKQGYIFIQESSTDGDYQMDA
jgi:hypothetical protein